jgi:hypothetical protein
MKITSSPKSTAPAHCFIACGQDRTPGLGLPSNSGSTVVCPEPLDAAGVVVATLAARRMFQCALRVRDDSPSEMTSSIRNLKL